MDHESLTKLYTFYVERSSALYKSNDVIIWLKEVAGFVCDSFDANLFDK